MSDKSSSEYNDDNLYRQIHHHANNLPDQADQTSALLDRAQIAIEQDQPASAIQLLDDSPTTDLPADQLARYYYLKGWALLGLNQSEEAEEELTIALPLAEQGNNRELAARIRNRIGISYYQRLYFAAADEWFVQCWSAIRDHEINDTSFKMHIHNNLGNTALRMGNFAGAIWFYREALNHARNLNDDTWMGSICLGLSLASLYMEDYGMVMLAIKQGLELEQRGGSPNFLVHLWGMYAMALIRLNQPYAAEQELYKVIKLSEHIGASQTLIVAQGNLAEVYMMQEKMVDALNAAQFALDKASQLHASDLDLAQLLHTLAKVHNRMGHSENADQTYDRAVDLMRSTGDTVKLRRLLFDHGHALICSGDFEKGIARLIEANSMANPTLKSYLLV